MAKIRVRSIDIGLAMPGMVLAREVCNAHGQVLLQGGAELTESSLSGLIRRNIGHVCVFHEDGRSEEELEAERIKVKERIDVLFRNVAQDGVMGALRQMILDYRMGGLA